MCTGRPPRTTGHSSAELTSAILRDDPPSITRLRLDLPADHAAHQYVTAPRERSALPRANRARHPGNNFAILQRESVGTVTASAHYQSGRHGSSRAPTDYSRFRHCSPPSAKTKASGLQSFPSNVAAAIPTSPLLPTASPTKSSPTCPSFPIYVSSLAAPRHAMRNTQWTCAPSPKNSTHAMCWKAASVRPDQKFASQRS